MWEQAAPTDLTSVVRATKEKKGEKTQPLAFERPGVDALLWGLAGIAHNVDKLRRCPRNEGTVWGVGYGWEREGDVARCSGEASPLPVFSIGATIEHAPLPCFVFHLLSFIRFGEHLPDWLGWLLAFAYSLSEAR